MGSCHSFPYPMQLLGSMAALLTTLLVLVLVLLIVQYKANRRCFSLSETNQPLAISSSNAFVIYLVLFSLSSILLLISLCSSICPIPFVSICIHSLRLNAVYDATICRTTIDFMRTNKKAEKEMNNGTEILLEKESELPTTTTTTTMTTTDT